MRKIFSFIFTVLMVCLCISGCSPLTGNSGSGSAIKITDDNQRIVTLKKVPERIVVLSPSFLELVEAVDGKVVGRAKTQVGKVPAFAKDAAEVGFIFNINVEKIVELKPDLVIAYKGMHERYLHTLESNNIPVVVLNLKSYEDVKHSMLTIGKIMRKDDKAQKVVANLDKDINATVSKLPKSERSVAILHTTSMGITMEKETSIAGCCAKMLKLRNVVQGETKPVSGPMGTQPDKAPYSLEDLLEKNPPSAISDNTFWTGENDAYLALVGCYRFQTGWSHDDFATPQGLLYLDFAGGNGTEKENFTTLMASSNTVATNGNIEWYWKNAYTQIAKYNNFLANVWKFTMD